MKIGTLVDQLGKLREKRKLVEAKAKELSEQYNAKEKELFNAMKEQGVELSDGKYYKASISKTVHPSVTDWGKLYAYIKRNGAFDMLQRRVSSAAYKERLEDGKKVPGVEPFTKISMNLRSK